MNVSPIYTSYKERTIMAKSKEPVKTPASGGTGKTVSKSTPDKNSGTNKKK